MSCQTDIPIKDIADIVGEDFIAKEGGKGTDTTLIDPRIRGDVALDKDAKEALCGALGPCITDALEPLETEIDRVDQKADEAANAADNAMDAAQSAGEAANAATEAAQSAERTALNKAVARVLPDGDKRVIVLQDGTKIPFFVTDQSVPVEPLYQDEKVVGFGIKGDNVVITMIDGTEHDLTRQEFADWLAAQDTPLATDNELAEAIAQGTGVLQEQIDTLNQGLDSLQAQIDAFDADQAMLFTRDGKLVLRNEDNTEHEVPLTDLIPLSPDAGNLLTMRENGIYYGIEAPPNLQNIYVDGEHGVDGLSVDEGGGTIDNPFKTFEYARSVIPEDNSNTIHLRAINDAGDLQTYYLEGWLRVTKGAIRQIKSYGHSIPIKDIDDCNRALRGRTLSTSLSAEVERPIISRRYREPYYDERRDRMMTYAGGYTVADGSKIVFSQVVVDYNSNPHPDTSLTSFSLFRGSGSIFFSIADVRVGTGGKGYFSYHGTSDEVFYSFTSCEFIGDISEANLSTRMRLNGAVTKITNEYAHRFNPYNDPYEECTDLTLTDKPKNSLDILQNGSFITGIARNSLGIPLNVTSNFEI